MLFRSGNPRVDPPPPGLATSITLRENIAFIIWHLARESAADGRRSGALGVVAALLADTLPRWVAGAITPRPQDEALVTYAPRLTKEDGAIDWRRPAEEIARAVRAFAPWPLATTTRAGEPLAILEAWPLEGDSAAPPGTVEAGDGAPLDTLLPGRTARAVVA